MRSLREWLFGRVEPLEPIEVPRDAAASWTSAVKSIEFKPSDVRSIEWRESWGCWVAKRDQGERVITLHSRYPKQLGMVQLAEWAALEWGEKRPEPWIDAALAALAAMKAQEASEEKARFEASIKEQP